MCSEKLLQGPPDQGSSVYTVLNRHSILGINYNKGSDLLILSIKVHYTVQSANHSLWSYIPQYLQHRCARLSYIYIHSHYSIFHPERMLSSLPALVGLERQPNEDSGILSLTGADKIHTIVCVSDWQPKKILTEASKSTLICQNKDQGLKDNRKLSLYGKDRNKNVN